MSSLILVLYVCLHKCDKMSLCLLLSRCFSVRGCRKLLPTLAKSVASSVLHAHVNRDLGFRMVHPSTIIIAKTMFRTI